MEVIVLSHSGGGVRGYWVLGIVVGVLVVVSVGLALLIYAGKLSKKLRRRRD